MQELKNPVSRASRHRGWARSLCCYVMCSPDLCTHTDTDHPAPAEPKHSSQIIQKAPRETKALFCMWVLLGFWFCFFFFPSQTPPKKIAILELDFCITYSSPVSFFLKTSREKRGKERKKPSKEKQMNKTQKKSRAVLLMLVQNHAVGRG